VKNLTVEKEEWLEELPSHSGMRKAALADRIFQRDRGLYCSCPWKKIDRFLKSNVGKPWDEVYSKYCHLEWLDKVFKNREWGEKNVIMNTFMKDGKVWHIDNGEYPVGGCRYGKRDTYYVHPKTKILCFIKHQPTNWAKNRAKEEAKTMKILNDYHQLLKVDGIWYEVKAVPREPKHVVINGLHYRYIKESTIEQHDFKLGVGTKVNKPDDIGYVRINGRLAVPCSGPRYRDCKSIGHRDRMILDRKNISLSWRWINRDSITITLQRQLNRKDLKKYGLKNDVIVLRDTCKKCGGEIGKICFSHVCHKCGKYRGEDCKCYP